LNHRKYLQQSMLLVHAIFVGASHCRIRTTIPPDISRVYKWMCSCDKAVSGYDGLDEFHSQVFISRRCVRLNLSACPQVEEAERNHALARKRARSAKCNGKPQSDVSAEEAPSLIRCRYYVCLQDLTRMGMLHSNVCTSMRKLQRRYFAWSELAPHDK
jgi:hypothetical protein